MASRQDEKRLILAFGASLLAGSLLTIVIRNELAQKKAGIALGLFAVSVVAGAYSF